MPDFTVMTQTDRATIVRGIERGLDEIAKLRAQRDALAIALSELVAEFDAANDERDPCADGILRDTGGIALARTALAAIEAGKGPL